VTRTTPASLSSAIATGPSGCRVENVPPKPHKGPRGSSRPRPQSAAATGAVPAMRSSAQHGGTSVIRDNATVRFDAGRQHRDWVRETRRASHTCRIAPDCRAGSGSASLHTSRRARPPGVRRKRPHECLRTRLVRAMPGRCRRADHSRSVAGKETRAPLPAKRLRISHGCGKTKVARQGGVC